MMNHVERFRSVMSFQPVDRLPKWEWAMWWDKTLTRWCGEGLPANLQNDVFAVHEYFGLDPYKQFWFGTTDTEKPDAQRLIECSVADDDGYSSIRHLLYPRHECTLAEMEPWSQRQSAGEAVVWITLEGFFWLPRTLMGFMQLMLAFYDQPGLIHRINQDLLEFNLRLLDHVDRICRPTFVTIAEDMSYNNGPMVSREICDQFLSPYYRQLLERIHAMNAYTFVDTDGDVTLLVPWLQSVGVHGVLPLERQAGVDAAALRRRFPTLRMIGHFDKMVMTNGRDALRVEFDRLTPTVREGGFIPSVDHQTPPGVSLEQYHDYLRLLDEYSHGWVGGSPR
jgi:hypothetical protein